MGVSRSFSMVLSARERTSCCFPALSWWASCVQQRTLSASCVHQRTLCCFPACSQWSCPHAKESPAASPLFLGGPRVYNKGLHLPLAYTKELYAASPIVPNGSHARAKELPAASPLFLDGPCAYKKRLHLPLAYTKELYAASPLVLNGLMRTPKDFMLLPRTFSMGLIMRNPKYSIEEWSSTERDLKFEFNYTL